MVPFSDYKFPSILVIPNTTQKTTITPNQLLPKILNTTESDHYNNYTVKNDFPNRFSSWIYTIGSAYGE